MTDKCTSPEGHKYEPEYNITIWIESWRCVYCKQLASTEKIKVSLNEHASLTEKVERYKWELEKFLLVYAYTLHPKQAQGLRAIIEYCECPSGE